MARVGVVATVAGQELRVQARDGRVRVLGGLLAVSCLAVALDGAHRHQARLHEVASGQAAMHEQFVNQGRKNPHSGAHFGIYALRPEGPLGFAEPGLDDVTGAVIRVEAHQPNRYRDAPLVDRPSLGPFPSLSIADLLAVVGPLFIVFLVAPGVPVDREQGTLGLLLAQGIRPIEVLAGKALGATALVLLLFLPGVSLTWWAAGGGWSIAGRAALFGVATALYLCAFVLMALLISSRARTVRTALVIGLAAWTAAVVAGPRLGRTMAERLVPTPTAAEFNEQVDAVTWGDKLPEWELRENRKVEETMRRYGVSRKEDLPINAYGLSLQMQEDEDGARTDEAFTRLFARLNMQDRALTFGSLFAPVVAYRAVTMASAGTDRWQRTDFWWTVERYRRDLTRMANTYMAEHSTTVEGYDFVAGEELWRRVPPFRYEFPASQVVWRQAARPLVFLAGWDVMLLITIVAVSRRGLGAE